MERRGRRDVAEVGSRMASRRYLGATPIWALRTISRTLYSIFIFIYLYSQRQWYRQRADKLSATAAAARRSTKVGGGGAHKLSAAARRGRRTALYLSSLF